MNYLAHLFLAETADEHRIGSLLADFTNGTLDMLKERFSYGVARGIKHHRAIDRFTDDHTLVKQSADLLKDEYGIYSGIIVDVVYDHFLLRNWEIFSDSSREVFFESVYSSLQYGHFEYPERYKTMLDRLLERRWLGVYSELDNVQIALDKIDERFKRETPLNHAIDGIRHNYQQLNNYFLKFFPELVNYSVTIDSDF
jgi:acyl carrier protein phosphodiesterase